MKKLKKGLAVFLVFCLMLTSIQGKIWADSEPSQDCDILIHLDRDGILSEAENAIRSGELYKGRLSFIGAENDGNGDTEVYDEIFDQSTGNIYVLQNIPYAEYSVSDATSSDATASNAMRNDAELMMFVKLASPALETLDGDTTVSGSDAEHAFADYELNGDERIIFLFINRSDEELYFHLDIDGIYSEIVTVESGSSLVKEQKQSVKETAAETPSVETTEGVSNSGEEVTKPATSEETSAPDTTEEITKPASTEAQTTEASKEPQTTEASTEAQTTEASKEPQTTEASTEAQTTEASKEPQTTEASTEAQTTEASKEAQTTEASTEAQTTEASKEPQTTEAAKEPEVTEAATEPEKSEVTGGSNGEVVEASITPLKINRAMSSLTSENDDNSELGNEDEVQAAVYPAVLVKGGKSEIKSLLRGRSVDSTAGSESGAMAVVNTGALMAGLKGNDGSNFEMVLYDYSGTGEDASTINRYLTGSSIRFGASGGTHPFNQLYYGGKHVNIYQGILDKNVDDFPKGPYLKGNLFPDGDVWDGSAIKRLEVENPGAIFTREGGYYIYNSQKTPVKYEAADRLIKKLEFVGGNQESMIDWGNHTNNRPEAEQFLQGGFWPFGNLNFYHGMHFSFDFSLLRDGKTEILDENGDPTSERGEMVFQFEGDDDVFVYLTDLADQEKTKRLALDVGGIHNSMGGTINFATGAIKYIKTASYTENNDLTVYGTKGDADGNASAYLYTKQDWMDETGKSATEFDKEFELGAIGFPRKDLAKYKLDFYYLERGGMASNCFLKFNTPVVNPKKVSVAKRVVSNKEELRNGAYDFELYNEADELLETITVNVVDGYGTAQSTGDYLPSMKYYLKEVDNKGAVKTIWSNGNEQHNLQSGVGVAGTDTMLLCTNYYGDLAPEVQKKAVRSNGDEEDGYYDLQLTVSGDSLLEQQPDGTSKTYSLKNVTAVDELSENVKFALGSDGNPQVSLDGTDLTVTKSGSSWSCKQGDREVAKIAGKVIRWNVAEGDSVLAKGQTHTLTVKIETTAKYDEAGSYPDNPDANTGTHRPGTAQGDSGFYSNKGSNAFVTYITEVEPDKQVQKPFPKPVVRPATVRDGGFILEKAVAGETTAPGLTFTFKLGIKDGAQPYSGPITVAGAEETVAGGEYEISLQAGKSVSVRLPQGVTYTIQEKPFDNGDYAVTKTTIKAGETTVESNSTNEAVISADKEPRYVFTNTVSAYKPLTVRKVVDGRQASGDYEFVISPVKDSAGNDIVKGVDADGRFTVKALASENSTVTGVTQLKVHPGYAGTFTISESTGDAWKTDSEVEGSNVKGNQVLSGVKAGDTAKFTNYYYSHAITLKKKVEGYNPAPGKNYQFQMQLVLENGASLTDTEKAGIKIDGVSASIGAQNVIDAELKAEGTQGAGSVGSETVLSGLPAKVTAVKFTEVITQPEGDYKLKLNRIELQDGSKIMSPEGNTTTINLPKNQNIAGTVTFINQYEQKMGTLTLGKQIVTQGGDATKIDEARPFIFKVEKLDAQGTAEMTFYKTVIVNSTDADGAADTGEITVPAGRYRITEMDVVKYTLKEILVNGAIAGSPENPKACEAVVPDAGKATVIFKNFKTTDDLFTDVACKVNKATKGESGYEYRDSPETSGTDAKNKNQKTGEVAGLPSYAMTDSDHKRRSS